MKCKILLQLLRMTRLAVFGVFIQALLSSMLLAADGKAQAKSLNEINVTLRVANTKVENVFSEIEKQTNFNFTYHRKELSNVPALSIARANAPLSDVLIEVSAQSGLKFKRIDENIHVSKIRGEEKQEDKVVEYLQGISITGKVTSDESPDGLPGVNIMVKGTATGTVSDVDGNYKIEVPSPESVLIFSSVGFISEEVVVGEQSVINMTMMSDITSLSEIVVVGYGTQKRSDITGSVASVPKERLSNLPVTNVMHAIQGTTAGLIVTQNSSVPGSSGTMQVRGVNSINANTDPFVVLDGVPFFGKTNDINPNDIESIEILKDASAVAIYGTRGSNGVILITTKRGKDHEGKPKINYNGYVGLEGMAHTLKPMGPDAYRQKFEDFKTANGIDDSRILPNASEVENYDAGLTTDWLDEATQTGNIQEHNLSINGGTSNVQYYVSASHLNQKGVVKGYQFHRTSVRSNLDARITDYLKVGVSSFFSDNNYDGGRVNLLNATAMSPYSQPRDENGEYIIFPMYPETLFTNPLMGLTTDRLDRGKNLTGTGYLEIAPGFLKGFKYRFNGSYVYNIDRTAEYTGRRANDLNGTARASNTETVNWVVENIISYARDFDKHHIDFTGLYSAQEVDYFKSEATSRGFINDALSYYEMLAGASQSTNSEGNSYTLLSQMGRINYSYDSRYLLTLTARRDGYSAFGSDQSKYGTFPSMAVGWNLHNERFMSGLTNTFNQLKLRFSYGKTGNQAVPVNRTATTADAVQHPFGGSVRTGILYSAIGNANLGWETTTSRNLALDFGILKSRVSGTVEVYKSLSENLLMERNLPTITGYNRIWTNLGKMQNTGFELTLNTVNVDAGSFQWESSLNFSTYRNQILELYGDGRDDIGNSWFIGQPLRVIYGYEKLGIWQEGEDMVSADNIAQPGDIKFKDQDGDGIISQDNDRVVIGQRDPKWVGGFTNTFHYKNFHLSIFIQTSQGGLRENRDLAYADEAGRRNLPEGFEYWTPENPDNYWPSLSAYARFRGYHFAEDWSYVRIKDVRLSYTVPQAVLSRYNIQGLTLYVAGRNLYTFTDWFGWDPEMTYYPRGSSDSSGSWINNYPVVRTFSFGLNLSL